MVTEEEWTGEVARTNRLRWLSLFGGLVVVALIVVPCIMAGKALASGFTADLVAAGLILLILAPMSAWLIVVAARQQVKTDEKVRGLNAELNEAIANADLQAGIRDSQVQRQRFESRLANALDMAEGEPEVIDVIERSFGKILPDAPVELLLADNSHAHLHRMAAAGPDGEPPCCAVDSPDRCPAARRAQIQTFSDSDDLDACPKLRNRPQGRLSALCVPVSIMGRTVGVIHATGQAETKVDETRVEDLTTLAKLAGARLGLLRVMAETQLQASTDTLTGLQNRRSFSQQCANISQQLYPVAVAMADLDHFKTLNDTYGHETGDRALRLFARVLRDSLRASDILARYGGEEFAIAFPDCSAMDATRALDTVRSHLDAAITVGGLPKFTVSFGITEAEPGEEFSAVLQRADSALMLAKQHGRDRIVLHESVGGEDAPSEGRDPSAGRSNGLGELDGEFLASD
jgi:diguanylate cyclase (GGDEF)-like protein